MRVSSYTRAGGRRVEIVENVLKNIGTNKKKKKKTYPNEKD